MENNELLIKSVLKNEQSFIDLFCDFFPVYLEKDKKCIRYFDNGLKGMYDHNFYVLKDVTLKDFEQFKTVKDIRGENHIKISSSNKIPLLLENGFIESVILTMVNGDYKSINPKNNYSITFKNVRENPDIINDVIANEILCYGNVYGISFCIKRWNHYFNNINEGNNGLNIFACYYGNTFVGSCYTFYSDGVVALDALITVEEHRNEYIASNLIKHIANFYQCPIYLHADEEETAKELYKKLNFVTIETTYDYLKIDSDK